MITMIIMSFYNTFYTTYNIMYIPLHLFSSLPTAMIPSEHWEINLETPFSCEQTYEIWLQNWSSHLLGSH